MYGWDRVREGWPVGRLEAIGCCTRQLPGTRQAPSCATTDRRGAAATRRGTRPASGVGGRAYLAAPPGTSTWAAGRHISSAGATRWSRNSRFRSCSSSGAARARVTSTSTASSHRPTTAPFIADRDEVGLHFNLRSAAKLPSTIAPRNGAFPRAVGHAGGSAKTYLGHTTSIEIFRWRNFSDAAGRTPKSWFIVSEAMTQRFWTDGDAAGRLVRRRDGDSPSSSWVWRATRRCGCSARRGAT